MNDYDVATAAFARAVNSGRPSLVDVALEVGASAASQGVPLVEAMEAIADLSPGREPPYVAVRAVAQAWTGSAPPAVTDADCHDPLTSLASVPHLRTRLDDVYRQAAHRGGEPAVSHSLVVVELGAKGAHELEDALRGLEVAHALTVAFPAHETVARLAVDRFAALTRSGDADLLGLTVLARLLHEALTDAPEPRVWVERLPRDGDAVTWLLSRLTS
ncbi:hypothetical protein [Aeromicrobium sp. Leaf350]|uniref:hypothetical protein n=1 Tax=Aeromicrobium sp. Leaf350 TaxID=2876565 RepID=UPI001E559227|nr:hypothetical protein [Aeromicrobium sp. Leaf350]